jgi:hypothetical protein
MPHPDDELDDREQPAPEMPAEPMVAIPSAEALEGLMGQAEAAAGVNISEPPASEPPAVDFPGSERRPVDDVRELAATERLMDDLSRATPAAEPQRGRYYVPPKERAPATREQRRAQAREFKAPSTLAEYHRQAAENPELPSVESIVAEAEAERGDFPAADALRRALDADVRQRNGVTDMLIDHARTLDFILERLERERV